MPLQQIEALAIVPAMLGLFAWGQLRYDVVALLALTVAALTGIVPAGRAFLGFANPVVVIIASVFVLSRAVVISGIVEVGSRRLLRGLRSGSAQIGALSLGVAGFSAFMKNVGALGLFMPIAIRIAEREGRSPSFYLMPLAFSSLIGGTITEIGTSPNLLISSVRQDVEGRQFALFDFVPVGLPLTVLAVAFLAFGWRLIPSRRRAVPPREKRFEIEDYLSEVVIPPRSPLAGKTVDEIEELGDGAVAVTAIIREGNRRYTPNGDWKLFENDVLVLRADPTELKPFLDLGKLDVVGATRSSPFVSNEDEPETAEAIVMAESPMLGHTPLDLHLRRRLQVNLLSISRGGRRITTRLDQTRFRVADVVALQGRATVLPEALAQLGCLPLAERSLTIGRKRSRVAPIAILLATVALAVSGLVAPEVAFFAGAVLVVTLRFVSPKEAYEAIDWPIVVMIGALIPVGESLRQTGAAGVVGSFVTVVAAHVPAALAVALVLLAAMLLTPFLHHAAAVLVVGPIAALVAQNLGLRPDAFLMAVALGASCDFLTPIGHQNNLLVMGPGGYRFGDYWRLGLPLSILVAVLGTPLILHAWPLH